MFSIACKSTDSVVLKFLPDACTPYNFDGEFDFELPDDVNEEAPTTPQDIADYGLDYAIGECGHHHPDLSD